MDSLSLVMNCGYARVAVVEFSRLKRGKSRSSINRVERVERFQELFKDCHSFDMHNDFWGKELSSGFNRCCDSVLDCFCKKWYPQVNRSIYLETFSTESWKSLTLNHKTLHSLNKCSKCAEERLPP